MSRELRSASAWEKFEHVQTVGYTPTRRFGLYNTGIAVHGECPDFAAPGTVPIFAAKSAKMPLPALPVIGRAHLSVASGPENEPADGLRTVAGRRGQMSSSTQGGRATEIACFSMVLAMFSGRIDKFGPRA